MTSERVPLTGEDPPYVDVPVDEGKNPELAPAAPDDWPRTALDRAPHAPDRDPDGTIADVPMGGD